MANQDAPSASSSSTAEASKSVSYLCKRLHLATANLVRQSNKLPTLGDGHELYSSFAKYDEFMRLQRNRAIILLRRLTNYQRLDDSVLSEGMGPLIGVCDSLADRAAISLDEHEQSLIRDRIKARNITLGAEQIQKTPPAPSIGLPSALIPRESSGHFACAPIPAIVRSEQTSLTKLIRQAHALALKQNAAQSAAASRERNANGVLDEFEANRITPQRAKLELRIDLSRAYKSMLTIASTEERQQQAENGAAVGGTMGKLIEIANRWERMKIASARKRAGGSVQTARKSASTELKKLLNRRKNATRTVVLVDDEEEGNDNGEQQGNGQEATARRKDQIRNRIEHEWVSPYDNYVLMARQKALQNGTTTPQGPDVNGNIVEGNRGGFIRATTVSKKRTTINRQGSGVETEEEETVTKQKRYSHLDEEDETEERKLQTVKTEGGGAEEEDDGIIVLDAEERAFLANPANLTRKARKRQQKKTRGGH